MGDHLWAGKPSWYVASHRCWLKPSTLHGW